MRQVQIYKALATVSVTAIGPPCWNPGYYNYLLTHRL